MKDQTIIVLCAMLMLAGLEAIALSQEINGVLFSAVVAVIAGLAGWTMPQLKLMKGGN